ncbi:hypothetical protein ADUPG1_006373 [Aduncisulcus paluster]|uniref:Uncharacterized protein n=1 Tax=Aduncisulcus paluster TaxID=2918883 RepID=A0ABQ5KI08_9EUKA|nr:hypothetical protein ADUPG1_006373 [Aduncisulcus paluster]|eukprot:gnl/Carplike_NY0171/1922_a2600_781.p1 GENE.gnl/Carplike_NY0171/1922_a2600_781~~gnl/Carplike_NY0171/1922_a2600_781.p1  ORF type:complete len:177 (+),score=39.65 gnl/Carplike_NY0171/1922_a2600_781:53-583(+)
MSGAKRVVAALQEASNVIKVATDVFSSTGVMTACAHECATCPQFAQCKGIGLQNEELFTKIFSKDTSKSQFGADGHQDERFKFDDKTILDSESFISGFGAAAGEAIDEEREREETHDADDKIVTSPLFSDLPGGDSSALKMFDMSQKSKSLHSYSSSTDSKEEGTILKLKTFNDFF